MRFAISSLHLGPDLVEPKKFFDAAFLAGFQGVEIAQSPNRIKASATELLGMATKRNLKISGFVFGRLEERQSFAEQTHSDYLVLSEWDDEIRRSLPSSSSVSPALHPGAFRPVKTIFDAYQLVAGSSSAKLAIDTAHQFVLNDNIEKILELDLELVAAVHLKDWTPKFGRSIYDYQRGVSKLGSGAFGSQIRHLLEGLQDAGFSGWLVAEHDFLVTGPWQDIFDQADWLNEQNSSWCPAPKGSSRVIADGNPIVATSLSASVPQIYDEEQIVVSKSNNLRVPSEYFESILRIFCTALESDSINIWSLDLATRQRVLQASTDSAKFSKNKKTSCIARTSSIGKLVTSRVKSILHQNVAAGKDFLTEPSDAKFDALVACYPTKSFLVLDHVVEILGVKCRDGLQQRLDILSDHASQTFNHVTVRLRAQAMEQASFLAQQTVDYFEYITSIAELIRELVEGQAVAIFVKDHIKDKYYLRTRTDTQSRKTEMFTDFETEEYRHQPPPETRFEDSNMSAEGYIMSVPWFSSVSGEAVGLIVCEKTKPVHGKSFIAGFSHLHSSIVSAVGNATVPVLEMKEADIVEMRRVRYISHEFKKSQQMIAGAASSIVKTNSNPIVKKAARLIECNAHYLNFQVRNSDLHRYWPRPVSGFADPQNVLFGAEVVHEVAKIVESLVFYRLPIEIEILDENEITLNGDKLLLRLALFNIVWNSACYTTLIDAPDENISIRWGIDNDNMSIEVIDHGVGFSAHDLEVAFTAGKRGRYADKIVRNGQGLGLWVSKRVAQSLGGDVTIERASNPTIVKFTFLR